MRVFIKWAQGGGDAGEAELSLDDSLELVRENVASVTGTHPTLQQLIFRSVILRETDNKTVREYGIGIDDDLQLAVLPGPRVIMLNVGGDRVTTLLATLRKIEGSLLARMFDGLGCRQGQGCGGLPEGIPQEISTVLVPRDADGAYVIDRDPVSYTHLTLPTICSV